MLIRTLLDAQNALVVDTDFIIEEGSHGMGVCEYDVVFAYIYTMLLYNYGNNMCYVRT